MLQPYHTYIYDMYMTYIDLGSSSTDATIKNRECEIAQNTEVMATHTHTSMHARSYVCDVKWCAEMLTLCGHCSILDRSGSQKERMPSTSASGSFSHRHP